MACLQAHGIGERPPPVRARIEQVTYLSRRRSGLCWDGLP